MSAWIFKIIYMPIMVVLSMASVAVLLVIFKDVGWDVPFRWLVIICGIAYVADYFVNR